MTYDAVLFIGFGGPEKPDDIMPFLEDVTRGRHIPPERLRDVARHYERLGGKSPINEITFRQAKLMEKSLALAGHSRPVYIGQRHWAPHLEFTLRTMVADGVKRAVGFPAAAHRSEASLERYIMATEEARRRIGPSAPVIDYVGPWFDHPLFIDTIVLRVQDALNHMHPETVARIPWYFIAHSIPCVMAKESTYVPELRRTAELVAQKFGKKEWQLAYSSRSGNPREPWLEPDVCTGIRQEAARGRREILLIPIGFIADHVEILYDLDVEARGVADELGVTFHRSQSVGDHPRFGMMMAAVVAERMTGTEKPEQRWSGITVYTDGRREEKPGKSSEVCYCRPLDTDPPCRRWGIRR